MTMFTTGPLPRRLLLLRRTLTALRESPQGRFLLITGPEGVGKGEFLRALARELPDWQLQRTRGLAGIGAPIQLPGEIEQDTLLLIDDIHLLDRVELNRILHRVQQPGAPRLLLLGSAPTRVAGATDVVSLPPLSLAETARLARQIVGVCTADTAHRIHAATGGLPQLIRELLDAADLTHWSRPTPALPLPQHWRERDLSAELLRLIALTPAGLEVAELTTAELAQVDVFVEEGVLEHVEATLRFRDPRHRSSCRADTPPGVEQRLRRRLGLGSTGTSTSDPGQLAEHHTATADLDSARLYLADSPGEHAELRAYLATYGGQRELARREFSRAPDSPTLADRQVFHQLANWDIEGIREWAPRSPDRQIYAGLLAAIDHGTPPAELHYPDPRRQQRADLITGWVAMASDDVVRARDLLGRRTPGDSELVGLWQAGFLARTLYILGEWPRAAAVVERGLALGEACASPLLTPLLLWTGAQIAAMSGHPELSHHYLSRMRSTEDSFLIQRLPAAMGRMVITSTSTELGAALRAGRHLREIVRQQDTQQPGFWPWEDIYATSLVAAGQVDEADEVVRGAEERYRGSRITSLHAKLLVPRASIQIQRGLTDAGIASLEDAVDAISGLNLPAYEARILFEFGSVLRRIGRRSQAEELFSRAEEVFTMMEATTMVHRCQVERRAGGMGGRRPNRLGLTPQEEQIALLVAEGATNRGVARELSLSTKTVEYHLTRVYRKLGLNSRSELPGALLRR